MEKIDSLDRFLKLYLKMPASRLKMSRQNVAFPVPLFTNAYKD